MLLGIWTAVLIVVFIEARRESGGAMDLAGPFFVLLLIGGLMFFLLTHVLIRKIFKPEKE